MLLYKKIIRSRETRVKILRALSFIPDRWMIEIQYFIRMKKKLNLRNPQTFTEKLQWYKLYYRDPLMTQCVDKADVRDFVKAKGLEDILIPCIGVYDKVEEIDWDALPERFVIKDTLGGGGNSIIIIKDRSKADIEDISNQVSKWLSIDLKKKNSGREWPYYTGKKHRIIIEEYLDSDKETGGLIDYKFFCFNGKLEYMYIIADRVLGKVASFGIFDSNMNRLDVTKPDEKPLEREIPKPGNFDEMVHIANTLSKGFPEARVDLYNVNNKIYFGEITFFSASGYILFTPRSFDTELGRCFKLPERNH